ncbi:hypothetical protein GC197_13485 [bacterium]|nr:hypothetical protein [bacterium]
MIEHEDNPFSSPKSIECSQPLPEPLADEPRLEITPTIFFTWCGLMLLSASHFAASLPEANLVHGLLMCCSGTIGIFLLFASRRLRTFTGYYALTIGALFVIAPIEHSLAWLYFAAFYLGISFVLLTIKEGSQTQPGENA